MNFIKKIVDGRIDDAVHLQFEKFSKGEFIDRALIKIKKIKNKYTINTSAEFANELVKVAAEKVGDAKINVTGAVVSTRDLTGELEFRDKKQFQGVKRYLIDNEMSGTDILNLLEKFPRSFLALSFNFEETTLKIKPKAPKSSKAKNKEAPKPEFCKLITTDVEIAKSFALGDVNFKEANFNHTFIIEEIIKPEGETDFAKMRELAKRKGKIIRKAIIDEMESEREIDFCA